MEKAFEKQPMAQEVAGNPPKYENRDIRGAELKQQRLTDRHAGHQCRVGWQVGNQGKEIWKEAVVLA